MLHYLGLSVVHYLSFLISMLSPNNDIVFRLLVGVTSYWRFPSRVSSKVFLANISSKVILGKCYSERKNSRYDKDTKCITCNYYSGVTEALLLNRVTLLLL